MQTTLANTLWRGDGVKHAKWVDHYTEAWVLPTQKKPQAKKTSINSIKNTPVSYRVDTHKSHLFGGIVDKTNDARQKNTSVEKTVYVFVSIFQSLHFNVAMKNRGRKPIKGRKKYSKVKSKISFLLSIAM